MSHRIDDTSDSFDNGRHSRWIVLAFCDSATQRNLHNKEEIQQEHEYRI